MQVYKFHFYKLNTYGRKSKKLHERKTALLLNTVSVLDCSSSFTFQILCHRTEKKNPMHPNHMKITLHAPNTTTVAWPAIMEWHQDTFLVTSSQALAHSGGGGLLCIFMINTEFGGNRHFCGWEYNLILWLSRCLSFYLFWNPNTIYPAFSHFPLH